MPPPIPPRNPLSQEEKVHILWADKLERERSDRQTLDTTSHELASMVRAAFAQAAVPRFERVDAQNDEQLGYLQELKASAARMDSERAKRITAEVTLAHAEKAKAEREANEAIARQAKASDRKHKLAMWAIFGPLAVAVITAAGVAINSQLSNAHSTVPATEKHP